MKFNYLEETVSLFLNFDNFYNHFSLQQQREPYIALCTKYSKTLETFSSFDLLEKTIISKFAQKEHPFSVIKN